MPAVNKHRKILGDAVRHYRQRSGFSQEKLAEKVDLHPTYISMVECGTKNISTDALIRIAKALNVRLRDLVWDI